MRKLEMQWNRGTRRLLPAATPPVEKTMHLRGGEHEPAWNGHAVAREAVAERGAVAPRPDGGATVPPHPPHPGTLPSPTRGRVLRTLRSLPFWGVHAVAVVGVLTSGWSWSGVGLALALYYARMFFLTAGFHRYFSHRSFKTSRAFQLVLAVGGTLCVQKGVLWWASNHRRHHRHADQPGDVHSPRQRGLWWAHAGWMLGTEWEATNLAAIKDFARYPELGWLNRHFLVPPLALAAGLFAAGGWWALLWGFFVSTMLLWHGTFTVNSLAHRFGSRRYATSDGSRNNPFIALITMGEGWHNNHHHYASSARQGVTWWEIDTTYYVLCLLDRLGVVRDLRQAPRAMSATKSRTAKVAVRVGSTIATPGEQEGPR